MKKLVTLAAVVVAATFALSACQKNSDMEAKGEKADNKAQLAKTKVKNAFTKGPAEKAGEKLDNAKDDS